MKYKHILALVLSGLLVSSCGGGGGEGTAVGASIVVTVFSGSAAPPLALPTGTTYLNPSMLIAPNLSGKYSAIIQRAGYVFDPAAALAAQSTLKVTSLAIQSADLYGSFEITTGAAYPFDPTLGMTTGLTSLTGFAANSLTVAGGATNSLINSMGGLPSSVLGQSYTYTMMNGATVVWVGAAGYVIPYSATMNPSGYTYQTFGSWIWNSPGFPEVYEDYFSAGAITVPGTLPVAGTANYSGITEGSYVDAVTKDPSDTTATMHATVDFGTRTVTFFTTATTSLSTNAATGTLAIANPGLNMSGTLSYAAGSNTFTGAVTAAYGESGNVTCRFYGPGIAIANLTKVLGAPPEIGCTYAAMKAGVGAIQGALGGK